ncbi:MAG: hypothetical protein ACSHW0_19200, partial [Thalassotalea sp.]
MLKNILTTLTTVAMVFSASVNAADYTISFDESAVHGPTNSENWGTIIDNEYTSSGDVGSLGGIDVNFWVQQTAQGNGSIATDYNDASSFNKVNADGFLTLFNSDLTGTLDPDLQVNEGNLAVIHERNTDCNNAVSGGCTNPDDRFQTNSEDGTDGAKGGFVFIQFSQPVNLHSIDLADIEDTTAQRGSFSFYNAAGVTVKNGTNNWTLMDANGDGSYATQSFGFANAITTMVIRMQGSGGFKNLAFSKVPEPTTLAVFALG